MIEDSESDSSSTSIIQRSAANNVDETDNESEDIRLISLTIKATHVAADTTHKLNWINFPVFLCGTTDKAKAFHPFAILLSRTETHEDFEFMFSAVKNLSKQLFDFDFDTDTLLADDAKAITNGFKSVFTNLKNLIVCWAHRRRNMDDFFKSLGEVLQKEIVDDINFFQASVLKEHFETVYNLLKTKWTSRNVANIINMFDHCDQYWHNDTY
ncbi:hypothetical protein BpHYR1_040546 [Brachionus plicatilis]|uniref:MULE transposase domain-containing protein n=1 Tax=Brachionus plicatilis TaxID=10195 RepID=A0A3M7PGU6_BRAPC|nr:hypothetical protein BpHYR1_040546 [Brachionus plicatilis]